MSSTTTVISGFGQATEPRHEYDINQEHPLKQGQYAKFMVKSNTVPPPDGLYSSGFDVIKLD